MTERPLILDVDGTLIRSDLTHELLLEGFKADPLRLPRYAALGLRSKSELKDVLVERVGERIGVDALPLEPLAVEMAKTAQANGRDVYLCSGSEQRLVQRLADELDFITGAFGTTPGRNLTSENKADFLRERFPGGFDYVGNSTQDYAVWEAAHGAYAIRPPRGTQRRLSASGAPVAVLEARSASFGPLIEAMRPHHWTKNLLIALVPALVLERLGVADWLAVALGFVCLGLLASGTYLLNDMLDVHADRRHATKSRRPFASGRLSIPAGGLAFVLSVGAAFVLATLFLPGAFTRVMAAYLLTTLLYSFVLKRLAIADVITLAFLFLTRVAAGAALVAQPLSPWLTSFVLTFFLSVSLVKRYAELIRDAEGAHAAEAGRGYRPSDAPLVLGFGMMATAMTLIAFMLYGVVSDIPALRTQPAVLVVGTVITGWIMRLWLLAHRGELNDDPVLFAVRDPVSLLAGAAVFAVVAIERFGGV